MSFLGMNPKKNELTLDRDSNIFIILVSFINVVNNERGAEAIRVLTLVYASISKEIMIISIPMLPYSESASNNYHVVEQ